MRCRLVARDYRASGLSSLREGLYNPTASLEALRLFLVIAENFQLCLIRLCLATFDISTAFLYALLHEDEYQCVSFPTTTLGSAGERLRLLLHRAPYGLRRAPLARYRSLHAKLISDGLAGTSEATVLRYYDEKTGWFVAILLYVDDLLLTGTAAAIDWVVESLRQDLETKLTGTLRAGEIGCLEFFGREIRRDSKGGHLTLSMPPSYVGGVEKIMNQEFKVMSGVPKLSKFVDPDNGQILEPAQATLCTAVH